MPSKTKVVDNLNWVTERISNRVWSISIGVLAASLAYIVEATSNATQPFLTPKQVSGPAVCAFAALALDLVQYVAANFQNLSALREMEKKGVEECKFDETGVVYRVRNSAYILKVGMCFLSVLWISALIIRRATEAY